MVYSVILYFLELSSILTLKFLHLSLGPQELVLNPVKIGSFNKSSILHVWQGFEYASGRESNFNSKLNMK